MRYHILSLATAVLLTVGATMPAAAIRPQLLQHRPLPKKLPGNLNPANNVQRIVHLSRVPGALVSIESPKPGCASGTYPTSPDGLVAFDGTLYVRTDCQGEAIVNFFSGDRIDLSPVFAHGFRVDHVVFEDLAAANHTAGWQKREGRISMSGAMIYPLTTPKMLFGGSKVASWNGAGGNHVLEVAPPRYTNRSSGIHQTDEYRLDVYVVGPAGIDPYTGNRITKAVIN